MVGRAGSMESIASALTAIRAAIRPMNSARPMPGWAVVGGAAKAVMGRVRSEGGGGAARCQAVVDSAGAFRSSQTHWTTSQLSSQRPVRW